MIIWLHYCIKRLLSASTYTEICCIVDHSTYPCEDKSQHGLYLRFSLFTSDPFSPPHIWVSCGWSFSGSSFCLFIYGRSSLAMKGKSVMPTETTYMDTEDKYKYMVSKIQIFKVHIFKLHLLYLGIIKIHIFKSIFRFPISSLGLPNFSFLERLRMSFG